MKLLHARSHVARAHHHIRDFALAGCTPDKAMDFGPTGEIDSAPDDELSRQILHDFDGRDFELARSDSQAIVRLADRPEGKHVILPFWLGINPLDAVFSSAAGRQTSICDQPIDAGAPAPNNEYLIRAGSKLFKSDTVFKATRTHYTDTGGMLPTVVRFVGTRVITVPKDAPATGTITEKVPVLREVSMPMHTTPDQDLIGLREVRASQCEVK